MYHLDGQLGDWLKSAFDLSIGQQVLRYRLSGPVMSIEDCTIFTVRTSFYRDAAN
jgi:hypothetical protein